jgi:hypothetical protein
MSTKAQDFRVEQQRSAHPPKPKGMKKLRKEAARAADVVSDAAVSNGSPEKTVVPRNHTDRAARRGGARLEVSASGRPSRKSTRKSEGHIKLASNLTRRTIRKTHAPKTRAAKAASRAKR